MWFCELNLNFIELAFGFCANKGVLFQIPIWPVSRNILNVSVDGQSDRNALILASIVLPSFDITNR